MEIRKSPTEKQVMEEMGGGGAGVGDVREETEDGSSGLQWDEGNVAPRAGMERSLLNERIESG